MWEQPQGSNRFTTQHISFLCPLNILFPSLRLHQSKRREPVARSSKAAFWGPHSTQLSIAIHRTTPATLPAKQWHSRRNSRSTVHKKASQTDSQHPWLCWRELLPDPWTGHPNHQFLQPLHYSRCFGHRDNEVPSLAGASDLSTDHLPVIIDTACRSSFQHPPDGPVFRRTDWANFQTHLEAEIPFNPELHNEMATTHKLRTSPAHFLRF